MGILWHSIPQFQELVPPCPHGLWMTHNSPKCDILTLKITVAFKKTKKIQLNFELWSIQWSLVKCLRTTALKYVGPEKMFSVVPHLTLTQNVVWCVCDKIMYFIPLESIFHAWHLQNVCDFYNSNGAAKVFSIEV